MDDSQRFYGPKRWRDGRCFDAGDAWQFAASVHKRFARKTDLGSARLDSRGAWPIANEREASDLKVTSGADASSQIDEVVDQNAGETAGEAIKSAKHPELARSSSD
jgi:hypothetical protein